MPSDQQLITPAVDLFAPTDRFNSASNLYGQLHRWRLLIGKYWWVVLLILLLVLPPVWFLTFNSPPAYESKARMWVAGKLDISESRIYTEELANYLGTQAELLRSPMIQTRALARLGGQFTQDNIGVGSPFAAPDKFKGFWKSKSSLKGQERANPSFPFKVKVTPAAVSSTVELRAKGADSILSKLPDGRVSELQKRIS
jgi:uncharacterized protein involved in exopolysaccharide biosynthesis